MTTDEAIAKVTANGRPWIAIHGEQAENAAKLIAKDYHVTYAMGDDGAYIEASSDVEADFCDTEEGLQAKCDEFNARSCSGLSPEDFEF